MSEHDHGFSIYEYTRTVTTKKGEIKIYNAHKKYVKKGYVGKKSRFDDVTRAAIYADYLAGMKQVKIAVKYECSNMTITNIIKSEKAKLGIT